MSKQRVRPVSFTGNTSGVTITTMVRRYIVDVEVQDKDLDTLRALIDRARVERMSKADLDSEIRTLKLLWTSAHRKSVEVKYGASRVVSALSTLSLMKKACDAGKSTKKLWKVFHEIEAEMTPAEITKVQKIARERGYIT